jgi:hypothetical protein
MFSFSSRFSLASLQSYGGKSWAGFALLPDGQSSFVLGQMEYRSDDKGSWHFCENCPLWPDESFNIIILQKLPPPEFELCKTCVALAGEAIF